VLFRSDGDAELARLELPALVRAIASRSPVTELLGAPSNQAFRFSAASLAVLSDRALRGAVAGHLLKDEWRAVSVLGTALVDPTLLAQPMLLAIAVQLLLEMHLVCALDGRAHAPSTRDLVDAGAIRYAALLVATFDDDRAVKELSVFDDDHRVLLMRRAEAFRPRIPRQAMTEMQGLLASALAAEPAFLPS
jgi:hypothetical protein